MDPKNNSILTEDGQRITINDTGITGTEDPGPGLAYPTGNTAPTEDETTRSAETEEESDQ